MPTTPLKPVRGVRVLGRIVTKLYHFATVVADRAAYLWLILRGTVPDATALAILRLALGCRFVLCVGVAVGLTDILLQVN